MLLTSAASHPSHRKEKREGSVQFIEIFLVRWLLLDSPVNRYNQQILNTSQKGVGMAQFVGFNS